jgi:hypothetical protein
MGSRMRGYFSKRGCKKNKRNDKTRRTKRGRRGRMEEHSNNACSVV